MYSLVVPVYKNESTLQQLLERLDELSGSLDETLEVVLVIDGSPDGSYALLRAELPKRAFDSQLVLLSRNFGSFAAIRMGLMAAKGRFVAVMAADLQEPPELVSEFFSILRQEPVDVVMGVRSERDDPATSKLASTLFWSMYRRLAQPAMPVGGVDMFGCTQQVRDIIVGMEEANSTLMGLVVWTGFRRKLVAYRRLPRPDGRSGWTLRKKARYMIDSLYAFSDLPVMLLTVIGLLGVAFSMSVSAVVFVAWLAGFVSVQGYTPLILTMLLSTSMILLGMGVIGGYVWRAFENTKRRPLFIPMSCETFRRSGGGEEA